MRTFWNCVFMLALGFIACMFFIPRQTFPPGVMTFVSVALIMAAVFSFYHEIAATKPTDIWEAQQDLMRRSDQTLPAAPCMHKGSLLYAALMMEESGETFAALLNAYRHVTLTGYSQHDISQHLHIQRRLADMASILQTNAKALRGEIARVGEFWEPMDVTDAEELLDGVTDVAVVTAGFGLSSGLPAREGYEECIGSNLSKCNPISGKIDKDDSGKWIKGVNYRPADWRSVLRKHYAATEFD